MSGPKSRLPHVEATNTLLVRALAFGARLEAVNDYFIHGDINLEMRVVLEV